MGQSDVIDLSKRTYWNSNRAIAEYHANLTLVGNDLLWSGSSLSLQRDQTGSGNARALTRLQMRADLEFSFLHEDGQPEKDGLMLEVMLDFSGTTLSVAARRAILYDVTMEASTQT